MKTLIIPDIHNRIHYTDDVINDHKPDRVIFLGDYFDDFGDTPDDAYKTALWLKEMIARGYTMLFGNHDMSYVFPNTCICPGFSKEKHKAVKSVLSWDDWMKLNVVVEFDGYWISHAGMHKSLFCHPITGWNKLNTIDLIGKALKDLQANIEHPIFGWGPGRGGPYIVGGITWIDWSFLEPFWDKDGNPVKQLVGHTQGHNVRSKGENNHLVCLDTCSNHVAVLTNGKLEIHEADM